MPQLTRFLARGLVPHCRKSLRFLLLLALPIGVGGEASAQNYTDADYPTAGINATFHEVAPFKDRARTTGRFRDNWTYIDDENISVDSNGYPQSIPAGVAQFKLDFNADDDITGDFIVEWEGDADLRVTGGKFTLVSEDLTSTPKRRVYNRTESGGVKTQFYFASINPEDPPHDIHAWFEAEPLDSDPWREAYLARFTQIFHRDSFVHSGIKVLRFMDLQRTNGQKISSWGQRQDLDSLSWLGDTTDGGVPMELLVDLCNRLDKDIWLCIPVYADDDYLQNVASFINQNLDPGLKVYVEYGNEIWNPSLPNFSLVRKIVEERTGLTDQDPDFDWSEFYKLHGEKSAEAWKAFQDNVTNWQTRVVRVLGEQIGAAHLDNFAAGIARVPGTEPDAIAIGHYFGHNLHKDIIDNDWYTDIDGNMDNVYADLMDNINTHFLSQIKNSKARVVGTFPQAVMIGYEGGQHVAPNGGFTDTENKFPELQSSSGYVRYNEIQPLLDFLQAINDDERMYDCYLRALDVWKEQGGVLPNFYLDMGGRPRYGIWGLIQYAGQTVDDSPKARGVLDWVEEQENLAIVTKDIPDGAVGYSYVVAVEALRGTAPYSFSVSAGTLPDGLSLDSETCEIYGVPTSTGTSTFTLRVTDSEGATYDRALTLVVNATAEPIVLKPAEDTTVGNWYASEDKSGVTRLTSTGTSWSSGAAALIKFDLASVSHQAITSAHLRVSYYNYNGDRDTPISATVYGVGDDTLWTDTVTWNTLPDGLKVTSADAVAAPFDVQAVGWYEVDVTDFVSQQATGDGVVTLVLRSSAFLEWMSAESAEAPELVIEYAPGQIMTETTYPIDNGSFEENIIDDGQSRWSPAGSWIKEGNAYAIQAINPMDDVYANTTAAALPAPGDGHNVGIIYMTGVGEAMLRTPVITSGNSASAYTFTVAVGHPFDDSSFHVPAGVYYRVEILSDDTVVSASDNLALETIPVGTLTDLSTTADIGVVVNSSGVSARIVAYNPSAYGRYAHFDNCRFVGLAQ